MDEENKMEQTTFEEETENEEVGGIPGKLIAFAIGVVGGGLLLLKKKFGKKKYSELDGVRLVKDK